jgi:protein SCO1/2
VYADGNYTIGHSSSIYMIDRVGGLRAVMPYGHTADDFVHDLKILLRK